MAVTASGFYGQTLLDALDTTGLAIDLLDNTNNYLSLITNSATPNFDDTTPYFTAGGTEKDNEASGITAGGQALESQTWSISGGTATWDSAAEVFSGVTVTARASVIYDNGETNDNLIILHDFTQDYSSTSGDFTVSWNTYIMSIDYTP